MSLFELTVQPRADVSHFRASVVLERRRYHFRFYTQAIDDGWAFDVTNDDESAVVRGVAIVAGVDLLYPYQHLDVPPGQLFVIDRDGGDPDGMAFAEKRAALYYLESEAA